MLQHDDQHQRQADLEQLDNNTIVCSDTVLVNTLLTKIKYHAHIHNFVFFAVCFTY